MYLSLYFLRLLFIKDNRRFLKPSISAAYTLSPEGQTEIKSRYGRKGEIQVNTRTLIVSAKTITITEEAYERLKSRKGEGQSFSEVILQNFPAKRKLSQILAEIGKDDELADRIDAASKEMRRSKLRRLEI